MELDKEKKKKRKRFAPHLFISLYDPANKRVH